LALFRNRCTRLLLIVALTGPLGACAVTSWFGCSSLTEGMYAVNAGNLERGTRCLDGYLARHGKTDPPSRVALAYGRRGWAYQLQRRFDLALADYNEWLLRDPDPSAALLARAALHLELKNYDFAAADYQTVLKSGQASTAALLGLGHALRGQRRFNEALRYTSYAVAQDATPAALYARARIYAAQSDMRRAMADLDRAVEQHPDRPEVHYWRGSVRLMEREFRPAIEDLSRALELAPRAHDVLAARGAAYAALSDYGRAMADLDLAIEYAPAHTRMARMNRSRIRFALGAEDQALAEIEQVIELHPDWPEARLLHALYLAARGDFEAARWTLFRAGELAGDNGPALNNIAWVLATDDHAPLRNGELAVRYATQACDLAGWSNPPELDTLAAALAEAQRFDDAARRQRKAIEILQEKIPDRPDLGPYRERLALYEAGKPYRQSEGPRSPRLPVLEAPPL
jgi:tetratricopeptide (TPR) repeat protein